MKIYGNQKLAILPILLTALICLGAGFAMGYTSTYQSLQQTHNSLLEQRDHLLRLQQGYQDQINRLQSQLGVVQGYLNDNDHALRDIEIAMRNAS